MEYEIGVVHWLIAFCFGIISAKWTMDLGLPKGVQAVNFLAGLLLGPVVLTYLYFRLARKKRD